MIENRGKRKIKRGEIAVAITINPLHPTLAEVVCRFGYDFIYVEGEHFGIDEERLEDVVRAAELYGVGVIVRLASDMPLNPLLQRYLDIGVAGVHITQIRSFDDARRVVDAVKYPPLGQRGYGGNARASGSMTWKIGWDYDRASRTTAVAEFMEAANRETFISLSIETPEAIAALPEILKLEDVDVISAGHQDLSARFGIPGQINHPRVLAAENEIRRMTLESGKAISMSAFHPEGAEKAVATGAKLILTATTRTLQVGATQILGAIHKAN